MDADRGGLCPGMGARWAGIGQLGEREEEVANVDKGREMGKNVNRL